ncbi:glutamate formimidoyltransferase [Paramaledivibacter caminithermalis]|jgi:glutamate formiminotransferase|uniref:glutamate formimidoyltransferase n=1 Tax=Paramaledivibacter caminithermalis (strain DSM 15212 / CIP 107654 / DViRD3) TaxID=1121301 RepID=A0A1M6STH6_PARC5|nr:glutamate formimidoyltransferase [Paramaledivibacter caminithermalis]SHK47947.1 glutamate formiminotransferase [Paramaledivibacter caminithermalis DSM 15212]
MTNVKKIVECVPNFSEGRDLEKIEKIVSPFRGKEGVKLLNYEADKDYNRVVVTVMGEPEAVKNAVVEAVGVASEVIDMTKHEGQHSRMGATDVVPFIPIKNMSMTEAIEIAKETGKEIAEKYNIPVFLYEKAATKPERENLAKVRKGQFEGMPEKLKNPEWKPDFGEAKIHPTAGVTAVGARMPLVAYNIDLDTDNIEIANKIARAIRHSGGGYRFIKAGGVEIPERGITQVTMNLTDYTKTAIYRAFEAVKMEARRYGINVLGSEIIGLVPMEALIDSAAYYLGLYGFSMDKVLETNLME